MLTRSIPRIWVAKQALEMLSTTSSKRFKQARSSRPLTYACAALFYPHSGHTARSALLERNIISLRILQPIELGLDVLSLHEKQCSFQSSILQDFFQEDIGWPLTVREIPVVPACSHLQLFPAERASNLWRFSIRNCEFPAACSAVSLGSRAHRSLN